MSWLSCQHPVSLGFAPVLTLSVLFITLFSLGSWLLFIFFSLFKNVTFGFWAFIIAINLFNRGKKNNRAKIMVWAVWLQPLTPTIFFCRSVSPHLGNANSCLADSCREHTVPHLCINYSFMQRQTGFLLFLIRPWCPVLPAAFLTCCWYSVATSLAQPRAPPCAGSCRCCAFPGAVPGVQLHYSEPQTWVMHCDSPVINAGPELPCVFLYYLHFWS